MTATPTADRGSPAGAPSTRVGWNALFKELLARFSAAGVFARRPGIYAARALMVGASYGAGYVVLLTDPGWPLRLAALTLVSFAAAQGGMLAHDVDHGAVSRNAVLVRVLGQFFMTLLNGQAFAHWSLQHRTHHRNTNQDDDPDLQVDVLALYPADATRKRGLARLVTRAQHLLIWPLLTLQAFSIKRDTLRFIRAYPERTRVDRWVLLAHWALWLGPQTRALGFAAALTNYAIFTWLVGSYLASCFIWNHLGTVPVPAEGRLPFLLQRLVCTRNLSDHWLLTFLYGGLNFHIEHHLAPHAPASNLRVARRVLREFCAEHQLPYREYGYFEALGGVYRHVRSMAALTARIPGNPPGA